MRWIYISPHFDDAVLSCGGLIADQTRDGNPVEIWTICAGEAPEGPLSNFAKQTHKDWGTGNAASTVRIRREEDRDAAKHVGAEILHFNFPDCIYRRASNKSLLYPMSIFSPWNPSECNLYKDIAASIKERLQQDDVLVCPLAIGNHVDHIMVRLALESLDTSLLYYADIPYLLNRPGSLQSVVAGLMEKTYPVSAQGLHAWIDGISAYRSQVGGLFKTKRRMHVAISRYWESRHGVRLWRGS
jgi:LmbE family N-acetylglucosaminyl deacetylase